ncbi:hypothetical protein F5883DRAFT_561422 [Diaporthe sp. PMI_573]|nr:hypothetical protein F5883DRAFT_561422 [Diaporthaceae sp. PMI_573]
MKLMSPVPARLNYRCWSPQYPRHRTKRIVLNHAYQDANKRAALLAADMFLKIKGFQAAEKPICQR